MSSVLAIGWVNNLLAGGVVAGSEEVALPARNMQNDIGDASTAWQTRPGVLTPGAGASVVFTPPVGTTVWRIFCLARTNLTRAANVTFAAGDWTTTVSGPEVGYGLVAAVAPFDLNGPTCTITIYDPFNPDGFISVPLAFAGPAWIPATGMAWESMMGRDSQIDEQRSRGGQEYPIPRWQQRRWDVTLAGIHEAELWQDAQELDRIGRQGGNVLFIPNMESLTMRQEAIFGRVESVGDVTLTTGIAGIYGWKFRIRERL